jgi:hypothetical protein
MQHASAAGSERPGGRKPASQRQQPVQRAAIGSERGGGAGKAHRALFQHLDAVGERQRELDALLGEQNGQALRFQLADLGKQRLHHQRREPFRWLI